MEIMNVQEDTVNTAKNAKRQYHTADFLLGKQGAGGGMGGGVWYEIMS